MLFLIEEQGIQVIKISTIGRQREREREREREGEKQNTHPELLRSQKVLV